MAPGLRKIPKPCISTPALAYIWAVKRLLVLPLLFLALEAGAEAPKSAWYDRPECHQALAEVFSAVPSRGRAAIDKLRHAKDLDLIACSVWLEVPFSELEQALKGKSPALLKKREQSLGLMFKFAKRFGRKNPLYADLEIEARLRRVRILAEQKERMATMREARRVKAMLADRKGPPSLTVRYVSGVLNSAVGEASWAVRQLLSMAGLGGDPKAGMRDLAEIAQSRSIYWVDAHILMRHFAGSNAAKALRSSEPVFKAFPKSPQFAYDFALDLQGQGRAKDSLKALSFLAGQLKAEPAIYTPLIRARSYWLLARGEKAAGNKAGAMAYLTAAEAQNEPSMAGRIGSLKSEIKAMP